MAMEHDGGRAAYAATEVVATWPKGSFAENLAVDAAGLVHVTLHTERRVDRFDPTTGVLDTLARLPVPVAGLTFGRDGLLYVSGGTPGQAPGSIWRVDGTGTVARVCEIADAAFLNGMALAPDGRLLVAESLGGRVYAVDPATGATAVWLADQSLAPAGGGGPGANGIKLHDGHVIVTVTDRDRVMRTALRPDGTPGPLETMAERLRADDFAVGADGTLFIATHPARSLVALAPDGTRTTLAAAEHGMTGATAVAFGRRAADQTSVYVTTTGGTMTLPEAQWEPGRLVRVAVGTTAASEAGWDLA